MFLKHWFPIYVFCTMCPESRSIRFLRQSPYDKPFLVVLPFNIHCLLDFLKYKQLLSWLNFLIVLLVGILPNFPPLLFPSNAVSCLSVNSSKMRKVQYLCLWLALHLNHVALLVDHTTHPNGSFHLLANVFLSPSKHVQEMTQVSHLEGSYTPTFLLEAVNRGLGILFSEIL